MTPVSIIIPAWNLWHLTKQCLESIATSLTADGLHGMVEVIVVNNGSTDDTNDVLPPTLDGLFGEHGKEVRLTENMGFSKGCNAGAAAANHPLLFFLNNDTLVTRGFLPPLVHALETEKSVGAVGPLLLYLNDTVQHVGIAFTPTSAPRHFYELFPASHPLIHKKRRLQAITGAALLTPAALFMECGCFYEAYINGYEDIDLCTQIRKKKLFSMCIPQSHVYHLCSQSPGRFDHDTHNSTLITHRCAPHIAPDIHKILMQDGFTPMLDSTLQLYFSLPHQKEAALTNTFKKNFDEETCKRRLEAHPLWFQGHILLAEEYARHSRWDEALEVLTRLITFAPIKEHWILFTKAARAAHNTTMQALGEKNIQKILSHEQQYDKNLIKARDIHSCLMQNNEPQLQALYAKWPTQYAPNK